MSSLFNIWPGHINGTRPTQSAQQNVSCLSLSNTLVHHFVLVLHTNIASKVIVNNDSKKKETTTIDQTPKEYNQGEIVP